MTLPRHRVKVWLHPGSNSCTYVRRRCIIAGSDDHTVTSAIRLDHGRVNSTSSRFQALSELIYPSIAVFYPPISGRIMCGPHSTFSCEICKARASVLLATYRVPTELVPWAVRRAAVVMIVFQDRTKLQSEASPGE